MSPSAVASVNKTDMASNLTEAGVKHTIKDTAPSIAVNGHSTGLQELDASKITFTPNENPKAVPEANSPEVTKMSRYVEEFPIYLLLCEFCSRKGKVRRSQGSHRSCRYPT